jgi:hypothetical protein
VNGLPAEELYKNHLLAALAQVESVIRRSEHGRGWYEFFLLDEFREAAASEDSAHGETRQLARQLLARIASARLTQAQREFLEDDAIRPLRHQLKLWAIEPVDYSCLLAELEVFEDAPAAVTANAVADEWNRLRWTPHEETTELAQRLDTYYRNANVRFAVSGTLLNRLLPIVRDMNEDVDELILGNRVFGRSRTSARLYVRLIPDRHRWRIGLEARGEVDSQTASDVGPVRLFNRGESAYLARKLLMVGRQGVHLEETQAGADVATQLVGVQSNWDVVPLVGSLVRSIARSQHDAQSYAATREAEHRVRFRVQRKFDGEVRTQVAKAERTVNEQVLAPLRALELNPVATDMMTTQERLIMRCRLAGYQQLAANTPRPRAPSDSLLSVQIHQSAANNTLERLQLDGNEFELHELYRYLGEKFTKDEVVVPEDIPQGVTVRFADGEAVRVRFEDGRAMLSIRIAKIKSGRSCWRDFEVRGFYRPESATRKADLVRDGSIQLIGEKLGLRDQIALRGVFSKVLSKKRRLQLIDERLVNHPRLKDVRVTQYAIADGWIGVALASRPGHRNMVARPPAGDSDNR